MATPRRALLPQALACAALVLLLACGGKGDGNSDVPVPGQGTAVPAQGSAAPAPGIASMRQEGRLAHRVRAASAGLIITTSVRVCWAPVSIRRLATS